MNKTEIRRMLDAGTVRNALEKVAFGTGLNPYHCARGYLHPSSIPAPFAAPRPAPTVGNVLTALDLAGMQGVGSQDEVRDAFGRIIRSGVPNSSPAAKVLGMVGGGLMGRAITGLFTHKPIPRALGTGIGAWIGYPGSGSGGGGGGGGGGYNGFGGLGGIGTSG